MRLPPGLKSTSEELLHLDLMRLAASFGIVFLHFSRFLSASTQSALGRVDALNLVVDMFFTISGFVIAYVYTDRVRDGAAYITFLHRRVARLAPLHWFTLVIFLGLGVSVWTGVLHTDHPNDYDPRCLVPNLLALHAFGICHDLSFNDVSWSISAEMGMYLIAPALLLVAARTRWALPIIAAVAMVAMSFAPRQPWLTWTWYFGVARALPSFALGIAMLQYRDEVVRMPVPRAVVLVATILFLLGVHKQVDRSWLLPLIYIAVAAAIACDLSARYRAPAIGAFGQLTYSLYMIHPIVLTFGLSFVGQRVLRLHGVSADLGVLVAMIVTAVLAYVSYTRLEVPSRNWLNGRSRRVSPPAGQMARQDGTT